MAKVAVFTVGCKVNQAESEYLKEGLLKAGHCIVRDPEADLCVVNTCTVTAESDRKCRKLIRFLARRGATAIVVAGCYAEVSGPYLAKLPSVISIIPNRRKGQWLEEVLALLPPGDVATAARGQYRARFLLKVQDGCERGCSYCIVPIARGVERSRPLDEIIQEVEGYRDRGAAEVILCGVNLGRYGDGADEDLGCLVENILTVGGEFRVRMSSIELEDLKEGWIRRWSRIDRACGHLHIPLQSGDATVLEDMGRGYTPGDFVAMAESLREIWPRAALTTEVIVGYPGEDEAAFAHTLEILEKVEPARLHVFRYSPRPGTSAYGKSGAAGAAEVDRRSRVLRALAEEWRLRYIDERRGELRDLLVETLNEGDSETFVLGTTEDYIKCMMIDPDPLPEPGSIVPARIEGIREGRAIMDPL